MNTRTWRKFYREPTAKGWICRRHRVHMDDVPVGTIGESLDVIMLALRMHADCAEVGA